MYTNRIPVSSITLLAMACGLVLGGIAAPATAKTIIVTTLTDTANPPFDADGVCGMGTVDDLPGADDGLISLREAIIASNNTPGADTITFAPKD